MDRLASVGLASECGGATFYDHSFFDDQLREGLGSARQVVPTIMELVQPRTVFDIGCGVGQWLAAFQELGVEDILGVDGDYVDRAQLLIPPEKFLGRDLSRPLDINRRADLVISLEVAEHLPSEAAETFVDSLVRLGPVILFSAAIPGQGGTHHVNEQWPPYWKQLFESKGYTIIDCLRSRFWDNPSIGGCYIQNMYLYVDLSQLSTSSSLLALAARDPVMPLTAIHPGVWQHALNRPLTLRPILRSLPGALSAAILRRIGLHRS